MTSSRLSTTRGRFVLSPLLEKDSFPQDFCGEADLDEFFDEKVVEHKNQLLAVTYKIVFNEKPNEILGLASLLNDSLIIEDKKYVEKTVPLGKRYPTFPAIKIGRLGINQFFQGIGLGSFLLTMIKNFFLKENRTGCRYITVDAYISFYRKNGFELNKTADVKDETRSMFFDLMRVKKPN